MAVTFAPTVQPPKKTAPKDDLPASGLASVQAIRKRARAPKNAGVTEIELVRKADTEMIAAASQYLPEDEFISLYFTDTGINNQFLAPPFSPKVLKGMPNINNILLQCIEAMEVNIDGTGYDFVPAEEGGTMNPEEEKRAKSFFTEPYPGQTFVQIRRTLRRELEAVGWAALEVLRNVEGEILALRNIIGHTLRVCKAEKPVLVTKTVVRGGQEIELEFWERERKFGQMLTAADKRYYKEFGATRDLNRNTGEWADPGTLPPELCASELLFFRIVPDVETPYGLPRWVNQMPSVVGSRKAEEANLDYFDAGAMPPTIVFIGGGTASKDTSDALRTYLSGKNKNKQRAVVIDVVPTSGSLDAVGKTEIKVERFGSEKLGDAMFAEYDQHAEDHVRVGFRLPPLFIGRSEDYNFASAQTSYMVAEAQVFKPERDNFDAVINSTIMRALKCTTVKMQSKPVTMKDAAVMMEGLTLAKDVAEGKGWMAEVNKVTGLALAYDEKKAKEAADLLKAESHANIAATKAKATATLKPPARPFAKPPVAKAIKKMAQDFMEAEGLIPGTEPAPEAVRVKIQKSVDELEPDAQNLFNYFVALAAVQLAD